MTPKTIFITLTFLLVLPCQPLFSQDQTIDTIEAAIPPTKSISLQKQHQQQLSDSLTADRINKNKTNLTILAAWAGVNIIQGSISATNAKGSAKSFFRMNAYWNVVNLGIAAYGLTMLRKQINRQYSFSQNYVEQQKTEKLLLLNTGLDAAYIATGFYLKERGARLNKDQATGFGNSLILQGAFLLVFDLVQYGNHRRNGKILEQQMGNWNLGLSPNGIGLAYSFK